MPRPRARPVAIDSTRKTEWHTSCNHLLKANCAALALKVSKAVARRKGAQRDSMWIVKLALSRPYTFIVLALLILLAAPVSTLRTPTDIFPNINIPVVSIGWQYTGLNPEELEGRLTEPYEKALTTLVDNIQHIESTTYNGTAVVKVFLQPGASLDTANAQVTAASQFMLRKLPPA